jgi:hypothetical protein
LALPGVEKASLDRPLNLIRSEPNGPLAGLTSDVPLSNPRYTMADLASRNDPWVVISYELDMFMALGQPILPANVPAEIMMILQNAVVESRVLHARNLCDIFLSRTNRRDDITLKALLGGIPASLQRKIDKLKAAYGEAGDPSSMCWTFNKMLVHSTTHRGSSYDYSSHLQALEPLIREVVEDVTILANQSSDLADGCAEAGCPPATSPPSS